MREPGTTRLYRHDISNLELRAAQERYPPLWVIYRHPRDFPRHWVVRIWWGAVPHPMACLCDTIGEARGCVPEGLYRLALQVGDDPVIFETWI